MPRTRKIQATTRTTRKCNHSNGCPLPSVFEVQHPEMFDDTKPVLGLLTSETGEVVVKRTPGELVCASSGSPRLLMVNVENKLFLQQELDEDVGAREAIVHTKTAKRLLMSLHKNLCGGMAVGNPVEVADTLDREDSNIDCVHWIRMLQRKFLESANTGHISYDTKMLNLYTTVGYTGFKEGSDKVYKARITYVDKEDSLLPDHTLFDEYNWEGRSGAFLISIRPKRDTECDNCGGDDCGLERCGGSDASSEDDDAVTVADDPQ